MSFKNSVPESERFTYDYFFLDCVCRLCWGADGIIELSSSSSKSMENEATIAEKIQECIGIDVTTHSHPKKVCSKCLNEIEIFSEFKRFCQETDKKLHGILERGTLQKLEQAKEASKRKLFEVMIVKEESDVDFTNLPLNDSIDDFFDDLPLSCETNINTDRPVKKKRMERKNYCNFCHLKLESNEKLTQHNLECHGIEENGLYKCFGCEKKFNNVKKRLRHESETCKALKCGYKCGICSRFLPKRRVYEHHMRAHRENLDIDLPDDIYKCNKCVKTFESAECVRKHMLTHYQKEKKTYVCDICGRVFTRRDYLYKHKLVHEGGKHQKCPHCDYRAVQRSSLTVHIRKHTGERPYACDMCPHRCVTSSNLREHRKRHFGIKAFECKLCEKKFGYKISLEEHMSSVHAQSETHVCAQCGANYSRFRGLRRHLLAKHGQKVKKVKNDLIEIQNNQKKGNNQEVKNGQVEKQISLEVLNTQVEVQNSQMEVQNTHIQVQINQSVQNEASETAKMTFLEEKDVSTVRNTDGAVFMTASPIII